MLLSSALGVSNGASASDAHPVVGKRQTAPTRRSGPKWTDPLLNQPYVDIDEWRDTPLRHRYVHGGFKGTDARFAFYFPPKERYQGRFFEIATPVPQSEDAPQTMPADSTGIAFALASGGYFVATNENGAQNTPTPCTGSDPTLAGYRVNAAAAQFSRVLAERMYGPRRPYGYLYGGSGGAFRTVGGVESTTGVWDGSVPYVLGTSLTLPSMLTIRLNAVHVLGGKLAAVADAMDAGGSGDMYGGLDADERQALLEATRMGVQPKTWAAYSSMTLGVYPILVGPILTCDPTYVHDFWTVPGYGGATPSAFVKRAHFVGQTTITRLLTKADVDRAGVSLQEKGFTAIPAVDAWKGLLSEGGEPIVAIEVANVPVGDLEGATMTFIGGAAAGETIRFDRVVGRIVPLRYGLNATEPRTVIKLKPGDPVRIDNSTFLAMLMYHRYQVPPVAQYPDYHVWDQYRDANGAPIYPQRPVLEGPLFARSGAGSIQSGRFHGKMIVLQSMQDEGHFAWQADWYRTQVKWAFGERQADDRFRVWYTDNSMHGGSEGFTTHFVSYQGILQQALRDLSAWVEQGVPPPASTAYTVADGQVALPPTASERRGIQPIVTLRANGATRAEVRVGAAVDLIGHIDTPPGAGKVVEARWDFTDTGTFANPAELSAAPNGGISVSTARVYDKPGTYFAVLHVVAQRQGDASASFGRVENLDRVRIVVR